MNWGKEKLQAVCQNSVSEKNINILNTTTVLNNASYP